VGEWALSRFCAFWRESRPLCGNPLFSIRSARRLWRFWHGAKFKLYEGPGTLRVDARFGVSQWICRVSIASACRLKTAIISARIRYFGPLRGVQSDIVVELTAINT